MTQTSTSGQPALTILIVDDTPANVGVLVDYLEDRGFRVVVAQDGEEGIKRARFALPDLILLDVMMPGMDGFETCRRLKAHDDVKDIPVIFMTALTDAAEKVTGFSVGGVDYVTKPFQIEEVLARINTHLALRATRQQLEAQNQQLAESYAELKQSKERLEELHQQLLQSEKMASIGQLAAGVAHEINNPIAFVNSNVGTLQDYVAGLLELLSVYERAESGLGDHPDLQQEIRRVREKLDLDYLRSDVNCLLAESLEGLQRVRHIVQDLKDFSRVGEVKRQMVNLHPGLDSTLNIVASEIRKKSKIKKDYGTIPPIEGMPAQLNQVFMNLLMNASQAIEGKGTITIRTGHEDGWVWVEIGDTGCGIRPEHMARIFEPFFTTKPVGQGTGLGLSLSYGIVAQHGGRIEVKSEPGQGATFRVWLPTSSAG